MPISMRACWLGLVLAALATCLLGACRTTGLSGPPIAVTPTVEREVYEALIRDAWVRADAKVVVLDPAFERWDEGSFGERPDWCARDMWDSFQAAHRDMAKVLPRDLDPGLPVAWCTVEEFQVFGPSEGSSQPLWDAFHRRFPASTGWISLSPIGFSRDGRTALVVGTVGEASLSGSRDYFVLRRTARGWRLAQKHNISIA